MNKFLKQCDLLSESWQLEHFKDHKVYVKDLDGLKIIDFTKGSFSYRMRIIIDGGNVIVTGDLGDAIYEWCGSIDLEFFKNMDIHYFNSKNMASSEGKLEFDIDTAHDELTERFKEYYTDEYNNDVEDVQNDEYFDEEEKEFKISELEDEYEKISDVFDELKSNTEDEFTYISHARSSDINELEQDAWEWIYDIGQRIPTRTKLHLLALKLIVKECEKV